jgi:SPP1 gp7 family putative phage head morphogenesis protein
VLSVRVRDYHGHVYNLETPYGYFTVEGAYTGNTIRAANSGQREIWRQAREQGLIPDEQQRQWIASGDANTCPICAALDGTTVGVDEEFDEGDPPIHPQCRCTTTLVSVSKRAYA